MAKKNTELAVVTPEVTSVGESCKSKVQTVCNTVVVVQPFLSAIARGIIESRERVQKLREQIVLVEKQNNYSIQRMQIAFDNIRPAIESTNEQINSLLSQMKSFDLNNMNEAQTKTYNGLMVMVMQMREQIFALYNKVL